jgi:hypothetical protein
MIPQPTMQDQVGRTQEIRPTDRQRQDWGWWSQPTERNALDVQQPVGVPPSVPPRPVKTDGGFKQEQPEMDHRMISRPAVMPDNAVDDTMRQPMQTHMRLDRPASPEWQTNWGGRPGGSMGFAF